MIEVEVRDFQSIEHATIKIDGFTALVGRSNIGKSAFVRAVQACVTGAPVGAYVRHNPLCPRKTRKAKECRCQCSVHIRAEDFDLLWEKGDFVNRYTFNGTVYDKANQGTPDFLLPFVAPIKVGDDKELLQVAEQFQPIFLLDQPGTVIADVLGDVAQLDRINEAMRMAEKDRREAVATRKVRNRDITVTAQKLAAYDGLDGVLAVVRVTEDRFKAIEAQRGKAIECRGYLDKLSAIRSETRALAGVDSILPPDPAPLLDRLKTFEKVLVYSVQVADRAVSIRALSGVEAVKVPEPAPLGAKLQTFERLADWVSKMYVFQAWFDARLPASRTTIPDTSTLTEAFDRFTLVQGLARRAEALEGAIATLEEQIAELEREATETDQEFKALGVCPTCGQPIHPSAHAAA